mgnify:CR=1 FL=1
MDFDIADASLAPPGKHSGRRANRPLAESADDWEEETAATAKAARPEGAAPWSVSVRQVALG